MVYQGKKASMRGAESIKREERAQRILDVAVSLILRWGYHKTTIDDIAREAGVGKGTLYLSWKTREELFSALILREKIAMAEDIKERIAGDPTGATIRGLLKHSALALMQRPLLKALLLRDGDVFGKLVQSGQNNALAVETMAGFTAYMQGLREQGLVRTDLTFESLMAIFTSIFTGFFLTLPFLPDAFRPSDEELAELIAETGHRTLEPRDTAPPGTLQIASEGLTQYLDQAVARAQEEQFAEVRAAPEDKLTALRPRGKKGGRAKKLNTPALLAEARRMYADKNRSIEEICAALGISRASLYRYVRD